MGRILLLCIALLSLVGCGRDTDRPPERPTQAEKAPAQETVPPADLVLRNAYIYTVDADSRIAQALAIRDGRIAFVGGEEGVTPFVGPATREEDLGGRMVVPGFIDANTQVGGPAETVDLYGAQTIEGYLEAVAKFLDQNPERQVIVGKGWNGNAFGEGAPHKGQLDQVSDTVPILLFSSDHQAIWANSEALAAAGINMDTPDPPDGVIERDPNGLPIGVMRGQSAIALLERIIPQKSEEAYRAEIEALQMALHRQGITTIHDARFKPKTDARKLSILQKMAGLGELTVRVRGSFEIDGSMPERNIKELAEYSKKFQDDDFRLHSVKLRTDGRVGTEAAVLKKPYAHRADYRGESLISQEKLNQQVKRINADNLQAQVHAIGDGAVNMALRAFVHSRDINGPKDFRNSIAHIQLLDPDDLNLFIETQAVALMQPACFARQDLFNQVAVPNLGRERADRQYPILRLFEKGVTVAAASGCHGEAAGNPLSGIQVALTRRAAGAPQGDADGESASGGRVSLARMLRAFTINGAIANRIEEETGSIEAGKWADLIVLDQNLFQLPAEELHKARVMRTYYKGELVYDAEVAQ